MEPLILLCTHPNWLMSTALVQHNYESTQSLLPYLQQ